MVGKVIVVLSVPDRVRVFVKLSVFPAVPVRVYVPVVKVLPLSVVAVITPKALVPVKVCPASVRAIVAVVVGNAIAVPSVPDRVIELLKTPNLPLMAATLTGSAYHDAAEVPEVSTQVYRTDQPAATLYTEFPPDEFTVTIPELLFITWNSWPRTSVDVTGSTTVCVVTPVNT